MRAMMPMPGGSNPAVFRAGDTMRRPMTPWSPAVHGLLRHLEAKGFAAAPQVLGTDAAGNEMLSFIPGTTATGRPFPEQLWADSVLVQVGHLLRQYHDAVADYRPAPDSVWRYGQGGCAEGEIVCHNDLGPVNTVFTRVHISGFIDWEDARPGRPERDLANLALWWVPLTPPDLTAQLGGPGEEHQEHRLEVLCRAYGWDDPPALLPVVLDCAAELLEITERQAVAGDSVHLRLLERGYPDDLTATLAYVEERAKDML